MYHTLFQAVCASDYNTSLTWNQAVTQQVVSNAPLSSMFNQRGLMITRSDWTTNGIRMMFHRAASRADTPRRIAICSTLMRWAASTCPNATAGRVSAISRTSPRFRALTTSGLPRCRGRSWNLGIRSISPTVSAMPATVTASNSAAPPPSPSYTYNQKLIYPINAGLGEPAVGRVAGLVLPRKVRWLTGRPIRRCSGRFAPPAWCAAARPTCS